MTNEYQAETDCLNLAFRVSHSVLVSNLLGQQTIICQWFNVCFIRACIFVICIYSVDSMAPISVGCLYLDWLGHRCGVPYFVHVERDSLEI